MTYIPGKDEMLPFFKELNELFGKIRLENPQYFPNFLNADTILSSSDNSGENLQTDFQTYSFLFVDYNNSGEWDSKRIKFRETQLDFDRNMEFKKMKDAWKLRVLPDYLKLFENINGFIVTLAVHKNLKTILNIDNPGKILLDEGLGEYPDHIAEKILRMIHINAFITAGITSSNNKYLWYADQDSSIEKNLGQFLKLSGQIFQLYCPHQFKVFGFALTFEPDKKEAFDDLQSFPDLVAGAFSEYLEKKGDRENGNIELQEKTQKILEWYHNTHPTLKKLLVTVKLHDNGKVKTTCNFVG